MIATRRVLRMALMQHLQDTDIANLIALLMPTAFIIEVRCSPWVLHKHSHGSGRQHVPELKGHQTKFSSQLRLCVSWVSQHSWPQPSCLWFWLFMSPSGNTTAICIGLEQDEKHSGNSTIQECLLRSLKWQLLVLLTGSELLVNILSLNH